MPYQDSQPTAATQAPAIQIKKRADTLLAKDSVSAQESNLMKNQGGDLEVDSVFGEIGLPLELIPLESHK